MNAVKNIEFSGKTVLLIDPDPVFAEALANHLDGLGFAVTRAANLAEAEEVLENRKFDLVVTEILLEYKDSGLILCWKIKKKTPETRIIIVSGVSLVTGIHFSLSRAEEKNWIRADSILDKEIRLEQLDHELIRLFR